jgi:hypothetical protein
MEEQPYCTGRLKKGASARLFVPISARSILPERQSAVTRQPRNPTLRTVDMKEGDQYYPPDSESRIQLSFIL